MNNPAPFHHAPHHLWEPGKAYIITAGTVAKTHFMYTPQAKDAVLRSIRDTCRQSSWDLEAWAVLSNHYHFVARTSESSADVAALVSRIHQSSAKELNSQEGILGRRVWYQYWDTCLTFRGSYLARLRYVHFNPQRHGVCNDATGYAWCSARWLMEGVDSGFRATILSMPIERINVPDDF